MRCVLILLTSVYVAPAFAQDTDARTQPDTVTIAAGPAIVPRFEGADDYRIVPSGAIRGRVAGISFTTLGTALFVDLVPDRHGTKFVFGPAAHLTLNRSALKDIGDPQIRALGKVPVAIEAGAHAGISRTGFITSAYDMISLDIAVTYDVTGVHDSLIVTPSVSYGTPLSPTLYIGTTVSADYAGRGYAQRYAGVTPAQSLASGLKVYSPGGGIKDVNFGLLGNFSLSGDLRRGASIFAIGNYAKLLGEYGRSPVVRSTNQWFAALGLAYTF